MLWGSLGATLKVTAFRDVMVSWKFTDIGEDYPPYISGLQRGEALPAKHQ
jgi:hypothetical protein